MSSAASLLICGLLAGFVVAAAAFPAVAVSGLTAKASADSFEKLPVELKFLPPPQASYLYAKDENGKDVLLTLFYEENRRNIPLEQMGTLVTQAIVAAEDARFYQHHGVDLKGVARSLVANRSAGEVQQGASTLTMQYVRQALTYSAKTPEEIQAVTEDTPARKLREMRYAMALEKELPKAKILENYLNIAYYGHNAYGIFSASYTYFNKHPTNLTLPEAAMLAGLVQAPSAYDPVRNDNDDAAKERRDYVIGRMAEMNYVSTEDAEKAKKLSITLNNNGAFSNECVSSKYDTGFFCDYFKDWWKRQAALGKDANEREDRLRRGGYKIYTTLDVEAHQEAVKEAARLEGVNSPYALGMAVVEPGTGRIKSLAVNRKYSNNQSKNGPHSDPQREKQGVKSNHPNTVNPLLGGGSLPGYQAGSTFKMFTMIAALESGLPLNYQLYSPYKYETNFKDYGDNACNNHWCPKNHGAKVQGNYNMYGAFGFSVNTYFVQLIQQLRPAKVLDVAKRLGLQFRQQADIDRANDPGKVDQWGSFTLGVTDNTPLEMANAYATLAADGMYCDPLPVMEVLDVKGHKVQGVGEPTCKQEIKKEVAQAATDAARCPVGDKPFGGSCAGSTAKLVGNAIDRPIAGKTGTTDSNRTAWFIGYTRDLAGAAFIADPDFTGNTVSAAQHEKPKQLFANALKKAIEKFPSRDFTKPPDGLINGDMRTVPQVTCASVDKAKQELTKAGFTVYVAAEKVNSKCRQGTVARVEPGRRAPKGSQVSIYVSNGVPPPASPPAPTGGPGNPPGPRPRPTCRPPLCDRPTWPPGGDNVQPA